MDYVNPKELLQEVAAVAKRKSELGIGNMMIRGILAGAFLGFATSLAMIVNSQGLPPIVGAILFPVGFVMLVLLGFELATGNFALLPVGLLAGEVSFGKLLRNWSWVYLGNLVGSVFYAYLFYLAVTNCGANAWRSPRGSAEDGSAEENIGLHGPGIERMGHGCSEGHSLQLDGDDRRGTGPGLSLDHWEGGRHVASDHDVFRAGLRALHRQHVRHTGGDDVWRSRFRWQVDVLEPTPGNARQHRLGSAVHRAGAVLCISRQTVSIR